MLTRKVADETIMGFIRALTAAAPLRYVAALALPGATRVFLEDKAAALLVCLEFRPGAAAGQQVQMDVLMEASPAAAAKLQTQLQGRPGATVGQVQVTFANLPTGDDVIGFAAVVRRLGRSAVPALSSSFGGDLGEFGWPGAAAGDARAFARELRARLRG